MTFDHDFITEKKLAPRVTLHWFLKFLTNTVIQDFKSCKHKDYKRDLNTFPCYIILPPQF